MTPRLQVETRVVVRSLLIGGSGSLGPVLKSALSTIGDVTVTQRGHPEQIDTYFDAEAPVDSESFSRLRFSSYDVVVYAAGLTRLKDCESNPEKSRRVNHWAPLRVFQSSTSAGGFFVFVSSSAAAEYEGLTEDSAVQANLSGRRGASTYGLHKYLAERELLQTESAQVLRLSKVAFDSWPLVANWKSRLEDGLEVAAFGDHNVSPVTPEVVETVTARAVADRVRGLLGVSAVDQHSYLSIARYMAIRLGVAPELVVGTSATSLGDERLILQKGRLDTTRTESLLGVRMPTTFDTVERYL
jgi:dTDP-4-dehydrorhamnose reductase